MYPVWRPPQQRGFDPFGELYALRAELGRLISSALTGQSSALPDVDLQEADEGWTVTARLPGVAPDEVEVDVDNREVCIRAKSEAEVSPDADPQPQASRRRRFEYRLSLPGDIDPDQVDATMDHGLLVVRLPRLTKSRRRQITVGRRGNDTAAMEAEAARADAQAQREQYAEAEATGPREAEATAQRE
jgi:HSP20 family protein